MQSSVSWHGGFPVEDIDDSLARISRPLAMVRASVTDDRSPLSTSCISSSRVGAGVEESGSTSASTMPFCSFQSWASSRRVTDSFGAVSALAASTPLPALMRFFCRRCSPCVSARRPRVFRGDGGCGSRDLNSSDSKSHPSE